MRNTPYALNMSKVTFAVCTYATSCLAWRGRSLKVTACKLFILNIYCITKKGSKCLSSTSCVTLCILIIVQCNADLEKSSNQTYLTRVDVIYYSLIQGLFSMIFAEEVGCLFILFLYASEMMKTKIWNGNHT